MTSNQKTNWITLVGEPNVGKSTLLNALVGQKVSIVTPKPQTTRNLIKGIRIIGSTQIIFVDTPGIFAPKNQAGKVMVKLAWQGVADANQVFLITDASKYNRHHGPGREPSSFRDPSDKVLFSPSLESGVPITQSSSEPGVARLRGIQDNVTMNSSSRDPGLRRGDERESQGDERVLQGDWMDSDGSEVTSHSTASPPIVVPAKAGIQAQPNYLRAKHVDSFSHGILSLIKNLKDERVRASLIINKIDLIKREELLAIINHARELYPFENIFLVSALKKDGLDALLQHLDHTAVHEPWPFDKDDITDAPLKFQIAEIIREKIFMNTNKEIPYSVDVKVLSLKEEPRLVSILADILVKSNSHKKILIGKNASLIKKIGTSARIELEKTLHKKVFLSNNVKIARTTLSGGSE